MAFWLENNPGRVKITGYNSDDLLTLKEVSDLLGLKVGSMTSFCRTHKISIIEDLSNPSHRKYFITFKDLEYALASKRWDKPMLRLKNGKLQLLSKSLCVIFFEQLTKSRPQKSLLVRPISEQNISDFLCGRGTIKNVFERHNYLNHDGTPYKMRTHSFRHFLNTLANEGGLTDIELAWWFGRKNIVDNQAYDHRTATQMTEKARQMLLSGEIVGPIAEAASQLSPIDAKEFIAVQVNAVHHTQYGLCLHDFAQNPCDKHLNCLSGCKEFHRTKGNQDERNNLKTLKTQTTIALEHAKQESSEETWGADNWINHHQKIIENINKALAVDSDDTQISSKEIIPVNPASKIVGESI